MARIARLTVPGVLHHVISRFVDRDWFFASDAERTRYLDLLGRALGQSDWKCLAFCLMSNHIHLAMVGGRLSLESWSKRVHSPFARWLNRRHGRLGPVFADRPAVYLVPRLREAEIIAYIHNNPVRAHVAASARSSSWSSHRAYVGLDRPPAWLDVGQGLARAGCAAAPDDFERLVSGFSDAPVEVPDLEHVRALVRSCGPYELGTPTLSQPIEVPVVCRAFARPPPTTAALLQAVAAAAGMAPAAATRRFSRGTASMAKRVFIHAAVELGISIADASAALNVSRQRGSKVASTALGAEDREVVRTIVALTRGPDSEGCQS
jgi:hypothetical protein